MKFRLIYNNTPSPYFNTFEEAVLFADKIPLPADISIELNAGIGYWLVDYFDFEYTSDLEGV